MKTLKEIFDKIGHFGGTDIGCNDKGSTHSYIEWYDQLFSPYRKGCSILEIGLALGDSIKLWDEYFEKSKILGVDISIIFEPKKYKNNVALVEADATKLDFLQLIKDTKFDIVIDDGSHMEKDQVSTFKMLKDKMNKGGIYIIEDILALDSNRKMFESLHDNCEIVDLRKVKGRFDDVLIIYRF
jgi:23S rRNA U2552 (ribose-2'-O)-methylase RlmE/FtsJ